MQLAEQITKEIHRTEAQSPQQIMDVVLKHQTDIDEKWIGKNWEEKEKQEIKEKRKVDEKEAGLFEKIKDLERENARLRTYIGEEMGGNSSQKKALPKPQ